MASQPILLICLQDSMSSGGPDLMLPQEIWELVSGHLTTQEWARVCGTCRTMFNAQLDHTTVELYHMSPAGTCP